MAIRGVFFDLYGTLIRYGDMDAGWQAWVSVLFASLRGHGLTVGEETFAARCDGFFGRPEPRARDDGLTVYERRIRALCDELGTSLPRQALVDTATASAAGWHEYVDLDPEAIPLLEALRPHHTLALISNFDHPTYLRSLLAKSGLEPYFDAVAISGELGVKKPDPAIFVHALHETDLKAHEVIYVGDTAEDIDGAVAAGIHPVLIRRDHHTTDVDGADFRAERDPPSPATDAALDRGALVIARLCDLTDMLE